MEKQEFTQQVMLFQKTLFDTYFNTMVIAQNHSEKIGHLILDNSPWIPEKGKEMINEYTDSFKKNLDGFKKMVDNHFGAAS